MATNWRDRFARDKTFEAVEEQPSLSAQDAAGALALRTTKKKKKKGFDDDPEFDTGYEGY